MIKTIGTTVFLDITKMRGHMLPRGSKSATKEHAHLHNVRSVTGLAFQAWRIIFSGIAFQAWRIIF